MTKIMLVEDDKSLREIYGVRLVAEGYDIVTASDGEEALALAIKERPSLIITDVMMPKISGFDMLDILRSTSETRGIKVIMMTALSSEDQRQRGEQMGADRYLVKSQVGIEDVVRVVHEVLGDAPAKSAAAVAAAPTTPAPAAAPVAPAPMSAPAAPAIAAPQPQPLARPQQIAVPPRVQAAPPQQPVQAPVVPAEPPQTPPAPVQPQAAPVLPPISSTTPAPPSTRQRIIQPINDPTAKVNINELLDRELAKEAGIDPAGGATVQSTAQERAEVQNQLNAYTSQPSTVSNASIQPGQPHAQTNVAPAQQPSKPPLDSTPGATGAALPAPL